MRIRNPAFDDQKVEKKLEVERNVILFKIKIVIYLSVGLLKGRPSYRRSLQLSKENIQHLHTKHEIS
jgi:hypothetical protein